MAYCASPSGNWGSGSWQDHHNCLVGNRRISTPCLSESKMSLSLAVWPETESYNHKFPATKWPPITRSTCSAPGFKRCLVTQPKETQSFPICSKERDLCRRFHSWFSLALKSLMDKILRLKYLFVLWLNLTRVSLICFPRTHWNQKLPNTRCLENLCPKARSLACCKYSYFKALDLAYTKSFDRNIP